MPWCEASQLHLCTVNLQHHCWQVPELMAHKGKKAMVSAPTPGYQVKGRGGTCFLPGHRMDAGKGGVQQLLAVTVVGPEPGTGGEKGSQSYTGDREA